MKKIFTLILILSATMTALAQPISLEEAMNRSRQFLQSDHANNGMRRVAKKARLTVANTNLEGLYVFNVNGEGFVIASGDKRALPVLGYGEGTFDWQTIPENMRAMLRDYSRSIMALNAQEPAESSDETAPSNAPVKRAAVAPMITAMWGQDTGYDYYTPTYNGIVEKFQNKKTLTGCAATAMALIMNYHKWPKQVPEIPAYTYIVNNLQQSVSETFSLDVLQPTTFDWDNMRDKYLTEPDEEGNRQLLADVTTEQTKAVGLLMRYCGQSVQMRYSSNVSLTNTQQAVYAFLRYFGYDNTTRYVNRYDYSIDGWEELIYNEVAQGRPVLYAANADNGGHAFVCDGYDGQGRFHINWGWDGLANSYFSLSVLDYHEAMRTDANQNSVGFNINQEAIIGIKPAATPITDYNIDPILTEMSPYHIKKITEDGTFSLYTELALLDKRFYSVVLQTALFSKNNDGTWERLTSIYKGSYENGYQYNIGDEIKPQPTGKDGTRYIYIRVRLVRDDGSFGPWITIGNESMFFELMEEAGKVFIVPNQFPQLVIEGCDLVRGKGTLNTGSAITLHVRNKGSEYRGNLLMRPFFIGDDDPEKAYNSLVYGNADYEGYINPLKLGAFLRAGEVTDLTYAIQPWKEGNYMLVLYEEISPKVEIAYTSIKFPATPAAIDNISSDGLENEATVYDLQGRRVAHPATHGIYIQNGKKWVR